MERAARSRTKGLAEMAEDFLIEFGLDIYNPLRTPPLTDNFWQCTVVSRKHRLHASTGI